jgi:hypothetical protein
LVSGCPVSNTLGNPAGIQPLKEIVKVSSYLSGLALATALLVGGCSTVPERTPYAPAQEIAYNACVNAHRSSFDNSSIENNVEIRCQVNILQADVTAIHAELAAMHAATARNEVK